MAAKVESSNPTPPAIQIGRSRPPLEVEDLPTPEEVFKVRRIGLAELIVFVIGPSLIALGISIGSGEWLFGPLNIGQFGFTGLGWVILVSAVLQVFFNVELARFTVATGEVPIVAFGRTPPGYLVWLPVALLFLFLAFILGGWAQSAGSSLFVLLTGRANTPDELEIVRLLSIGLLLTIFPFVLVGRRIERTLELVQGALLIFVLISLVLVTLTIVPLDFFGEALVSLVTPAAPPRGTNPSLLGALAGFTAMAAGLNFMFISYYRDKGYGMGHKVGYLSGWLGGKPGSVSPVGKVFPENEKNAARWKRWFRLLLIDQWGVYFIGVMIGMLMPSILVRYLASPVAAPKPDASSILVYTATQLGEKYGPILFSWALLIGFVIMYTTQMIVLELLTRNATDGLYSASGRFRRWMRGDPRRFYYPLMLALIVVIGVVIHVAPPIDQLVVSGNISNFAALIFPFVVMYLNRRLPRPARSAWWSYLVLLANVVFFGFFFVNFLVTLLTGQPLVTF